MQALPIAAAGLLDAANRFNSSAGRTAAAPLDNLERETVARFHREAKAMSMLLHPNTVRETLVQALLQSPIFETRWRWTTATTTGTAASAWTTKACRCGCPPRSPTWWSMPIRRSSTCACSR